MFLSRLLLVVVILLSSSIAGAQPAPQRDSQALSLIQSLHSAMGGPLLAAVRDTTAIADVRTVNGDGTTTVQRVTFKTYGQYGVRIETDTAQGQSIFVTDGHKAAVRLPGSEPQRRPRRSLGAIRVPHLPLLSILSDLSEATVKVEYLGLKKSGDGNFHHVRIQGALRPEDGLGEFDAPVEVFIDPTTHLPAKIFYSLRAQDDLRVTIPVELRFSDYRSLNRLLVPFRVSYLIGKKLLAEYSFLSFAVNQGGQPSDFEVR